jgi:hypothetical protein
MRYRCGQIALDGGTVYRFKEWVMPDGADPRQGHPVADLSDGVTEMFGSPTEITDR